MHIYGVVNLFFQVENGRLRKSKQQLLVVVGLSQLGLGEVSYSR
jgi:hypothetical protein